MDRSKSSSTTSRKTFWFSQKQLKSNRSSFQLVAWVRSLAKIQDKRVLSPSIWERWSSVVNSLFFSHLKDQKISWRRTSRLNNQRSNPLSEGSSLLSPIPSVLTKWQRRLETRTGKSSRDSTPTSRPTQKETGTVFDCTDVSSPNQLKVEAASVLRAAMEM